MDRPRLLILLLLPVVASSSSTWPFPATPANVEVDLVFPRANQTYRPVWPFPIVFGIRNASSLWYDQEESADLEFTWKLVGFNDTTDRDLARDLDGTSFGSERWQPSMEQDHDGQPADDLLLKVWIAARDLANAPEKHFRLSYQLALRSVCPGTNATQPILEPGQIYFSTDDLIPELPNILPVDSCASHAASVAIADMQRTSETGAVCVVPGTNTAPGDRCGLKVDAPMAQKGRALSNG